MLRILLKISNYITGFFIKWITS